MLYIKATSLFALAIALALTLGAVLQPAAAQTSGNLKCTGCVNSKDVKNNGLKSKDIKNGQVKTVDLGNSAVTGDKIAADAVTGDKIAGGAVGSSEVAGESIPATDLQNEPGLDFRHELGVPVNLDVTDTWAPLRQVDITHPGDGYVHCIGMGSAQYTGLDGGYVQLGWHTLMGPEAPPSHHRVRALPAAAEDRRIQLSAMYTFQVSGAATTTFYLKGRTTTADPTAFNFNFHGLVCMYFPTLY